MFGNLWSQLSLKNFLAKHDNPYVFISSQWQNDKSVPNGKYLIYRITVTIYLFLTWLLSIVLDNVVDKWPIYLTNWGYTTCTLQSLLASLMLLGSYVSMRRGKGELIKTFWKAYPVYWILNTIATPTAFGITTIYWSIIYDPKKMNFTAINFFVHGSNSLVMFFDVWIVCHPIKLLHFIYPIIFGVFYVSFSAVYFVAGGTASPGWF
ncbi:unnamed protein product [Acanthoscelides obtectus]|uniref:Protein rolling stone n=1 Tax=Acanthoscelides obtectus TaxID=200917 RepID=A0A9P0M2I9_ACAOB|nr:unnamed protein product [Acanthoscelides obtectus]CAK1628416.1 Protein rolling stone [Acanthoscelides obtectus]